jgi:hypothetical protein
MLGRMGPQKAAPAGGGGEHEARSLSLGAKGLVVDDRPVLPEYGSASLCEVLPTLLARRRLAEQARLPSWFPGFLAEVDQVVLFVLDGLGHEQLRARGALAPALSSMQGGPITSVAPTTTATALASIATGAPPAAHGVVGYRVRVSPGAVLNVLRWSIDGSDARASVPPAGFSRRPPFLGSQPPVVLRAEFNGSGFTEAYLPGVELHGWRMPSSICVEVAELLERGDPLIYAYYDGIDKVAHDAGLGERFDAELVATDRIVADLLGALPSRAALVVTADHGQVEVTGEPIRLAAEVMDDVVLLSGEGRFRWLHVTPGAADAVAARCQDLYGDLAWVRTRDEVIAQGWLGGVPDPEVALRLGDVALAAREPVAFFDPSDTGELRLVARHGSLTAAEMFVPFLASAP